MRRIARNGILILAVSGALAACGGSGTTSPTPASAHTAESGEPALIQVTGYQYQDPSDPAEQSTVTDTIKQVNDAMPGAYTSGSLHYVVKDGAGQIVLMEYQFGPEMAPLVGESIASASGSVTGVTGPGVTVSTETISTQPVASAAFAKDGKDYVVFAWVHNGIGTSVLGENKEQTRVFIEQYLTAAHA
jgi:hypothetical protein